jgi:glycosyltransferase involved in cell wall biosynthesis
LEEPEIKYAILISCRNEEKNIGATLQAINLQTVPPVKVLVVNDGSTDRTGIISRSLGASTLRFNNRRHPVRGVNLAEALNAGLNKLWGKEWDLLLKVDADSVLSETYAEDLIDKFGEDETLGISSGNPQDEHIWKGRASDGAKMFRRKCLSEVDWFPKCNAFDTLMILRAKFLGWTVRSFEEIRYTQVRTMRRENVGRWILSGRTRYRLGFPVWHTFLIFLIYVKQKPMVIGSFSMFMAHALSRLGGIPRPWSQTFNSYVGRFAMTELLERIAVKS